MNSAIELHDSHVQSVESTDGVVRIVLSNAYVHRSTGKPGIDPGNGYSQAAELVFFNATSSDLTSECSGSISDGSVQIGAQSFGLLPLPCSSADDIRAKFIFTSGASFSIVAKSFNCIATGSPTLIESYGG